MKFAAATNEATAKNNATKEGDTLAPEVIENLRHRLVTDPCRDSVEVKVAIVGELVYQVYKQLSRKRYL